MINKVTLIIVFVLSPLLIFCQDEYLVEEFNEHKAKVFDVAFSKSGKYLASGCEEKLFIIRNLHDRESDVVYDDNYFPVKAIEFFGDRQMFVTAGRDVKLIDLQNQSLALYKGNSTHINSLDFAPERNKLTVGSYDRKIKVWDVQKETVDLELVGHEKNTLAVAFSRDEKYLVSGSLDLTIKVWNAQTGELIHSLERHSGNILEIQFHPNTRYFASASADKTIRLWDVETGAVIKTYAGHEKAVLSIAFSPDGYYMYSASLDGVVYVWEVATGKKLHSYVKHVGGVNAVAVGNNGYYVATAGDDGNIFLWHGAKSIVVDLNYQAEYNAEKSSRAIFEKKRKGESKDDYAKRMLEAIKVDQELVESYFRKYLESKDLKNIPAVKSQ